MPSLSNFIYLKDAQAIFAYIPKNACTNWKCVFRRQLGYDDWDSPVIAHSSTNGLTLLSELDNGRKLLADSTIKKYSVTRNPFTRVLSAFLNKVHSFNENYDLSLQSHGQYFESIYKKIQTHASRANPGLADDGVTFMQFLEWIIQSDNIETTNEHWMSQFSILSPDEVDFSFIGKMENLEDDAAVILSELNIPYAFPTQQEVRFPGQNTTQLISQYYDKKCIDLVLQLYQHDFAVFNYEKHL